MRDAAKLADRVLGHGAVRGAPPPHGQIGGTAAGPGREMINAMDHFIRPDGSPPVNGYSHAVAFTGPMVTVSGQVPVDGDGNTVGKDDAEAQMRQVYANLATALRAAGSALEHVVKLTVYLTDLDDLGTFRKVRDEHQDAARPPACSLVQVAGLVHPDFRVEIEAWALAPDTD